MSKQLRELQARKATLVKDARALTDIAAAEQRDMNEEEVSAFEALKARIEATSAAIDREAALIAEEAQMGHAAQLPFLSFVRSKILLDPCESKATLNKASKFTAQFSAAR